MRQGNGNSGRNDDGMTQCINDSNSECSGDRADGGTDDGALDGTNDTANDGTDDSIDGGTGITPWYPRQGDDFLPLPTITNAGPKTEH